MNAAEPAQAVPMRYCYAIDASVTTPEEINRLWEQRHPHGMLRSAFFVTTAKEDAFFRQEGLLRDEDDTWWLREGGGSTLVDVGDDEIDKAVFRFLIEHRELFSRLWYGAISKNPNDDPEITLYLQEQEPAVHDGDAA